MKKLLITESDEIITFDDFVRTCKELNESATIESATAYLDYSIKHGIIKIINE